MDRQKDGHVRPESESVRKRLFIVASSSRLSFLPSSEKVKFGKYVLIKYNG